MKLFKAMLVLILAQACFAGTTTVKLEPAADTCISRFDKDKNFGSAELLQIYGNGRKALFRFDLGALPPAATVVRARLFLTFQKVTADYPISPKRYFAYDLGRDFVENQATNTQSAEGQPWASEGLEIYKDYYALPYQSAPLLAGEPGEYNIDVTGLVRLLRESGKTAANITVFGAELNAGGFIYSREFPEPQKRPRLEVDYSVTTPQARAGGDVFATAKASGAITVDGSGSSLPDGTRTGLVYEWTVAQPAAGSSFVAGRKIGDRPVLSFAPDRPGFHVLRLRVTNARTGEYTEDAVAVTSGLRPHPRIEVDADLIKQIRALRDSGDPAWKRFNDAVKIKRKPGNPAAENALVVSYLFAFLVTGEKQYFDWAWELMPPKIYRNGTDRSGGLLRLIDFYRGDHHRAAFQGGAFIAQVAKVYDWGYEHLSVQQRQDLIDWLNDAVSYNYLYNHSARAYFRNDGASFTHGLAAAAYATIGDNPEAPKQFGWFRKNWAEILKALDIMGKGGASGEGNAYGASPTGSSLIRTANIAWYASGEDLFLSHTWFRQRLLYDAFGAYPGTIGGAGSPVPHGWPGSPIVEEASIGGDGRRGASWHSASLRPNGLILSRRFAGAEEANIWNWVYRQPAVDRFSDASDCVYDLLFYSPKPPLVKPTKLSHFDPSMGFVYIRSDWNSPDATWIAFWAGPHLDTHQHLDQGAFAIFKRRDLAPKTGHYDADNVSSSHDLAYYTRTVSSNGLLIGDPSEVFRSFIAGMGCDANGNGTKIPAPDSSGMFCIPNDGGQRTMSPFGMGPGNPELFKTYRDVFDVARVVFFEDNGKAVSIVADITNAYNSLRYATPGSGAKVTKVYRRLVYLRGLDLLLVGDTVEATNADFEKKWLIHSLDRIEVAGEAQPIGAGESLYPNAAEARIVVDDIDPSDKNQTTFDMRQGYAALLIQTLFPNQFRYRKIGGREPADTPHADVYQPDRRNPNAQHYHRHIRDFWVKDFSEGVLPGHKSFNWMPKSPIETAAAAYEPIFGPGYGRWRLEIEPAPGNKTDFFLNVLKPALDPAEALSGLKLKKTETGDAFGVEIQSSGEKYVVLFSKSSLDPPRITIQ